MVIKYKTRWDEITPVECERETESCVYIKGRRYAKESSWENYHDSWADAHAFLVDNAQGNVDGLRLKLEQAKGKLGQIKGMKPPKGAA
jgi:hypothetical protein